MIDDSTTLDLPSIPGDRHITEDPRVAASSRRICNGLSRAAAWASRAKHWLGWSSSIRTWVPPEVSQNTRMAVASDVASSAKAYLHVGFGHSATTFLQEHVFPSLADHYFYCGRPYQSLGGLFSTLKYVETFQLAGEAALEHWAVREIYQPATGRKILLSDESIADWSEIFYAPAHLPRDEVACRLRRLFPNARILFTIRNQVEYIKSCYLNLKRNYLRFDNMPIPDFHDWFNGLKTQERCLYLQNLNYSALIKYYADLFGKENIFVLPLELLKLGHVDQYVARLSDFLEEDVGRWVSREVFQIKSNARMTQDELLLMQLAGSSSFSRLWNTLLDDEMKTQLERAATKMSAPLKVELTQEELADVSLRVREGNREIQTQFGLPLRKLGYIT